MWGAPLRHELCYWLVREANVDLYEEKRIYAFRFLRGVVHLYIAFSEA